MWNHGYGNTILLYYYTSFSAENQGIAVNFYVSDMCFFKANSRRKQKTFCG